MARLAQRAENNWVGVNCGIMDQMIAAGGRGGHALLIDCRSLETRRCRCPRRGGGGAGHGDAPRARGLRLQRAARGSARRPPRLRRDRAARRDGRQSRRGGTARRVTRRRARHVVTENARTVAAAEALRTRRRAALGELMDESHASLRDDFEVSRRSST